jgi:ribosomal protein S18 acetylase RimI-like enzyme
MSFDPCPSPSLAWRPATLADGPAILNLMQAFYAEEAIAFDGPAQGRALDALLSDPSLGNVFLLRAEGAPKDAAPLGHLVLTRGHSLEFGGRFLLLDELYLAPSLRGRGEGRRALDFAKHQARAAGAEALRLEVSHGNSRAQAAYRRAGFVAETRDLMTLRLA